MTVSRSSSMEKLNERVNQSELGQEWADDPLMKKDLWLFTDLGYTKEECRITGGKTINFKQISLPWLKYLTKLTVKYRVRQCSSQQKLLSDVCVARQLNRFLTNQGYVDIISVTSKVLQQFVAEAKTEFRSSALVYATRLWAEEGWLNLSFTPPKRKRNTPKIETIPEQVLYQIYTNFDLFPEPLERLFRLQIALGCRLTEMLQMPRHCLKQEQESWFLRRWIAKRKQWQFYQVHPLIVELVQEQQRFIDKQFGINSNFDKLFCKSSTTIKDGARPGGRFNVEPVYHPQCLAASMLRNWLKAFSEKANLRDEYGNRFNLTSHMFRRTKASIMAYCETEDEYIAAVLGHGSLDMLPHYRKYSLERLEKEANVKGYVDVYGRVTGFKPRKRRYEKLATILTVNTSLGECHRPTMLGDCQYRYACLNCQHHRVSLDDRAELQQDRQRLQKNLEEAVTAGKQRRMTEIKRLLELVDNRLRGLQDLQTVVEK